MKLFTIGYEKKSIEHYFDELRFNQIHALIDIRANPISRKPGFSKKQIKSECELQGIEYFHFPEAGIPSFRRNQLKLTGQYDELFSWYRGYLDTIPEAIEKIINLVNLYSRIALNCFERDFNMCHRKPCAEHIQRKLNTKGLQIEIIHL